MSISRPSRVHFFESLDDLLNNNSQRLPIEQIEKKLAEHRKIDHFTWMEIFAGEDVLQIFGNEKTQQIFIDKLIDSNKMGICYFGEDIGYGTVAVQNIKAGELLIFTGRLSPNLGIDDHHNPYLSQVSLPEETPLYVDAERKGGFSSMLLDVPSEEEAVSFEKRAGHQYKIMTRNFHVEMMKIPRTEKNIIVLIAMRDIAEREMIGVPYASDTRLMYLNFIGFSRDGTRLPALINKQLNDVIYKKLIYNDLSMKNYLLFKTIKNIKKSKLERALDLLSIKESNIKELTLNELIILFAFLKSKDETGNSILFPIIYGMVAREIRDLELNNRKLTELLVASNIKQLEFKGDPRLLNIHTAGDFSYHVNYPGRYKDCAAIAEQYKKCRETESANRYYQLSLFYRNKEADNEKNLATGEIKDRLASLTS